MHPSKWLVFIRPALAGFDRPLTGDKISEGDLKVWLVKRVQECGYQCPDYDEGTINDLVYEDRVNVIIRTNRQTWFGYLRFLQQGGSNLTNKPVLIGF
jgi:hypothetical protein